MAIVPSFTISLLDIAVIIGYFILLIIIGLIFMRRVKTFDDLYLAGRALPYAVVVGTIMATWYGAGALIGEYECGYLYGAVFTLAVWCIPAHFLRVPLALWIAPRVRLAKGATVPDIVDSLYGRWGHAISSVAVFMYATAPNQFLALGMLFSVVFKWPLWQGALFGLIIVLIYTVASGLFAVSMTDLIQMVLLTLCAMLALPAAFSAVGGWAGIHSAFPVERFTPSGGMPWTFIIMFTLITLPAYISPDLYQRFSSAKSRRTMELAILTCFIMWLMFDLTASLTGEVAAVLYPGHEIDPGPTAIKMVLSFLPTGFRGLYIAGVAACIMSTIDSYILVGGSTISHDVIHKIFLKKMSPEKEILLTRICIILAALVGFMLSFLFTTVVSAWIFIAGFYGSALVVPILGGLFWPKKPREYVGAGSMIAGIGGYLGWGFANNPFDINPVIIGMALSLIVFLLGNLIWGSKDGV